MLKVVSYYDLSVLSMFQKKKLVGGWGELYLSFFGCLEFVYFAKPLRIQTLFCTISLGGTTNTLCLSSFTYMYVSAMF